MQKEPQIAITFWTTQEHVERTAFAHSKTFTYAINGPRHNLDAFIKAYLNGESYPLPPLNWKGMTPFTKSTLEALTMIPFGKTLSYGELATLIGSPRAARAVGGALGRNPLPFIIPCHRVLGSKGIGGFSAGLQFKQSLLNFESFF